MFVVAIAPREAEWSTVAQTLNGGSAGGVVGCGTRLNCIDPLIVIPAKAGIPLAFEGSGPRFRGGDALAKRRS
jgi:hypothetical protein